MFLLMGEECAEIIEFRKRYIKEEITLLNGEKVKAGNYNMFVKKRAMYIEELTERVHEHCNYMTHIQKKMKEYSTRPQLKDLF